ncbi:MAG: N-acetyltransferase family protein [Planctomycetes bacterium]|nr:N-acetyltransferase family protein [Planctomycetota bacterium]
MKTLSCTYERHAGQILEILNDAIVTSTALFDYKPRPPDSMVAWFKTKEANRFPVIGVEGPDGMLLGFVSFGTFRAWPAYKYTVEHSVYVHKDHRRQGLGRALMKEIIAAARAQDYHLLVGGIEAANAGSIALHESLGFSLAGTIKQAGYKFGRWLDLSFYQLVLDTPAAPSDA